MKENKLIFSIFFLVAFFALGSYFVKAVESVVQLDVGDVTVAPFTTDNDGSSYYDAFINNFSSDNRYVVFQSNGDNLVPGDTNFTFDIFVRDTDLNTTERVSLSSLGVEGNGDSAMPSISADGRYVTFTSDSDNLVPGDTNASYDIFIRDLQTDTTTRISMHSDGVTEGDNDSYHSSISADGRYVAFSSGANNLVDDDTNFSDDMFLHDTQTGDTTRISVSTGGVEGDTFTGSYPAISRDGNFVVFNSYATNMVAGDTNADADVFVRDIQNNITTRVSVDSNGVEANSGSDIYYSSISGDGRYIAFDSGASNLVVGDTNGAGDVFRHDRDTGETVRVSMHSDGVTEGDADSLAPAISEDGRYISYTSSATTLIDNDTNASDDIFVTDMDTGETIRVSQSITDVESDGDSDISSISDDGTFVSFFSFATNLIDGEVGIGSDNYFLVELAAAAPPVVAPTITTDAATNIEQTTATLNGEITDTGGEDANERGFEYGIDGTYGSESSVAGAFGIGTFSIDIDSLECETLYHFRAFAVNSAGTGNGADDTFTTADCPSSGGSSGSRRSAPTIPIVPEDESVPLIIPLPTVVTLPVVSPVVPPTPVPSPAVEPEPRLVEEEIEDVDDTTTTTEPVDRETLNTPPVEEDTSPGLVKASVVAVREFLNDSNVRTLEKIAIFVPLTISFIALLGSFFGGVPALNYFFYLFIVLAQVLGIRKETKPWGTVYDSFTKKPLPFARVEIINEHSRKLQSTVADEYGRYGFLISEELAQKEIMQLRAYLSKYTFPSLGEPSIVEMEVYPNIYKGGPISPENNVTNYDLPLDPVNKTRTSNFYFGIMSISLNNLLTTLASILFVVGVILGIANFIFHPSKTTFAVLVFIFVTYILRSSGFRLKPFGLTKDKETKASMPFGLIALHNQMSGERVRFTVSDDKGRYFLLTQKGRYLLKAYTPSHIVPTRSKEIPIFSSKGWISKEVAL